MQWRAVAWGIGLQFLFAVLILRWEWGYSAFEWIGNRVAEFLDYSDVGAEFMFGENFRDHFFAFKVSRHMLHPDLHIPLLLMIPVSFKKMS